MTNEQSPMPGADADDDLDLRKIVESTFGPGAFDLLSEDDGLPECVAPAATQGSSATGDSGSESSSSPVAVSERLAEPSTRLVLFGVAEHFFALPAANVCEIQREPPITRLPHVPEWVRGVTNLRGLILSVIDLRLRMNIVTPTDEKRRLMIVVRSTESDVTTALLVDRVLGIHVLRESGVARDSFEDAAAEFIGEWRQFDTQSVAILDFEKIIDLRQSN